MRVNQILLTFITLFISSYAITDQEYEINYSGDGSFQDHGINMAFNRFVIDFGEIDLSKKNTKTFKFSGLPERSFSLDVVVPDLYLAEYDNIYWLAEKHKRQEHINAKKKVAGLDARLHIELIKLGGKKEFEVEGVLSDCIWVGQYSKPPIGIFMITYENECEEVLNANRQEQYETPYFIPVTSQTYQLTVEVVEPSNKQKYAKIKVTGGGWKAP